MIENDGKTIEVKHEPFPHLVADGLFKNSLLANVVKEFPAADAPGWKAFANSTERKLEGSNPRMWGVATILLLRQMEAQAPGLAKAFGTPPLTMETVGGGYHLIEPGGYLAMHADFSRSPATGKYRWLNMLVYLNASWGPENGSELQLWDNEGPSVSVAPEFNRTVVFRTSGSSWHGHPKPVVGRPRRSVAAYFYADEPAPSYIGDHSTRWHPKADLGGPVRRPIHHYDDPEA